MTDLFLFYSDLSATLLHIVSTHDIELKHLRDAPIRSRL